MYRLIVLFTLFSVSSISQKHVPFTGKLVYSIQITDTSLRKLIPTKTMVVYTNDTLLRIENNTDQLGKQVVIKHMILKKSYLLLRTPIANYAIQADHNTEKIDSFPYSFKKKWGKTTICGLKANRLKVSNINFPDKLEFLYLKNTSPKYLNTFENFPGIPVHYYLATEDGIFEYTLIQIDKTVPKKDLFGIPSDFKKVTFDEFMDEIMQLQMEQQNPPEKHE
jgi:hypothetical protein